MLALEYSRWDNKQVFMFFAFKKSVILVIKEISYGEMFKYNVMVWAQSFAFPVSILVD